LDSSGSGFMRPTVAGSFGHDIEAFGFHKVGNFLASKATISFSRSMLLVMCGKSIRPADYSRKWLDLV
jgi:hypothetical protein